MLLADKVIERLWPIFPREDFVAHVPNLTRAWWVRKQKSGWERNRPGYWQRCLGVGNFSGAA